MNENDDLKNLTPEERLQAENEIMKAKLQAEFGMQGMGSSLGKETENEWLNYIYNFEKQYAEAKRSKLFEFLGRPIFKKADELTKAEISKELERLNEIMNSKGVKLDTICDYENEVIYRFITEELFEEEMDDISIPGMMSCFIYEEFHPNHDYDIRKNADEFIRFLIRQKWDDYLNNILLASNISYNGKSYEQKAFPPIIHAFQSEQGKMKLQKWDIHSVSFDLETEKASLEGFIKYKAIKNSQIFEGKVLLELKLEYDYWSISKILIPGFSS